MTTAVTRRHTVTARIDTSTDHEAAAEAVFIVGNRQDADDADESEARREATWGELFDDPAPVESLAGYLHGMAYGSRLFGSDDSVATRAHIDRL